jgi:hypothetical protein
VRKKYASELAKMMLMLFGLIRIQKTRDILTTGFVGQKRGKEGAILY